MPLRPNRLTRTPRRLERLAELEADDAGAEDGDRGGERVPREDVVVDDEPVLHRVEHRRNEGRRAGRDDDRARLEPPQHLAVRAVDLEHAGGDEPCAAVELVVLGDRLDALDDEADEAVALAADAVHDRAAVDLDRGVDAERRRVLGVVGGLAGRDEELARHAADARAGRAVDAALDHHDALGDRGRGAVGREACRARADHGDVDELLRVALSMTSRCAFHAD